MLKGIKSKPYYARVALVGIGMYVFFAAIILVAVLVFEPSEVAFPLILAAVALIIGALIYFLRPWGLIVGVLGGLFGLLFSSDDIDINLTSPQSFFDFAFALFALVGAPLILFGSMPASSSTFVMPPPPAVRPASPGRCRASSASSWSCRLSPPSSP